MSTQILRSILFPLDDIERTIPVDKSIMQDEQLISVLRYMPLILFSDMVVGTYLFLILWFSTEGWSQAIWYGFLAGTMLIRAGFVTIHSINPQFLESRESKWHFLLYGCLASGIVWGCAWFILDEDAHFIQLGIITLWQCGVLAGAAASLTILPKIFFAFSLPPIFITTAHLFYFPDQTTMVLGGTFLSFVAFILPLGLHIGRNLNLGLTLKIRNLKLESDLQIDELRLQEKETELKNLAEEKLYSDRKLQASAEERLLLLESIEEGIFGINSIGKITFINSSALNLLKIDEEDMVGENATRLIRRNSDTDTFNKCQQAITDGYKNGKATTGIQGEFSSKNRANLPVRFSCWPITKDAKTIGAVISFSDISTQKEMEQLLIQSQKMEAIGRITGGLSHDFNNLLTVIIGNSQFLKRKIKDESQQHDLINRIMSAAKSGAELVNQLLTFSKEQELEPSPTDINELLIDVESFLTRLLGEDVSLIINACDEPCIGMTDRIQLQNAIINLCVNARDAMPNGGKLEISVRRTFPDWVEDSLNSRSKEFILLQVKDNGTGMSADVEKQIFEPFFTTKEKNKGSGLGLSMVYGFIKQSGGNVTVESLQDKGSIFNLYIPLADSGATTQTTNKIELVSNEKFHGTILVVEDDDNVRSTAAHMLLDAGFEVVTARNAKIGLQLFFNHPEIDLVFSDIIMPGGMNGIEMAKRILWKRPDAPILLATGYTEFSLKESISKQKNIVCVSKPYDTNKLPKVVSTLIEKVAS